MMPAKKTTFNLPLGTLSSSTPELLSHRQGSPPTSAKISPTSQSGSEIKPGSPKKKMGLFSRNKPPLNIKEGLPTPRGRSSEAILQTTSKEKPEFYPTDHSQPIVHADSVPNKQLSVSLDLLITSYQHSSLWKKTLYIESTYMTYCKTIENMEKFPVHTAFSLINLETMKLLLEPYRLQAKKLDLLRKLFQLFDESFQAFLHDHPKEQAQAEAFCDYLRHATLWVMDPNKPNLYEHAIPQELIICPSQVGTLEEKSYTDQAQLCFNILGFYKLYAYDLKKDLICEYIKNQIDKLKCDALIQQLIEPFIEVLKLTPIAQQKIEALSNAVEKKIALDDYGTLSGLLVKPKANQIALDILASQSLTQPLCSPRSFQKCSNHEENELYIIKNTRFYSELMVLIGLGCDKKPEDLAKEIVTAINEAELRATTQHGMIPA